MKIYLIIIYLIFINVLASFICVWDKLKAIKNQYRISEGTLWLLSFLGGSVGMYLTMCIIRHKTLHKSFMVILPALMILQMTLILLLTKMIERNII
ncbi:MAG: DUF1294 domain-containing protein [Clostridia bacterium]|nr:DUF1294 domain-containing protein [Clostridia bacterium]